MSFALVLSGPVASGKSTALDAFDQRDIQQVEISEVVRDACPDDWGLSVWADEQRDRKGQTFAIEMALDEIDTDEDVVISGVRDQAEIEYIERRFDWVVSALLWADRMERFARRYDELTIENVAKFIDRDDREMRWGLEELHERELTDYVIDTGQLSERRMIDRVKRIYGSTVLPR